MNTIFLSILLFISFLLLKLVSKLLGGVETVVNAGVSVASQGNVKSNKVLSTFVSRLGTICLFGFFFLLIYHFYLLRIKVSSLRSIPLSSSYELP